jgi:deoxycytidylate deaminase
MLPIDDDTMVGIMRTLYKFAWATSDDPKTKNAASIVSPSGDLIMLGCNHLPEGFELTPENLDNKVKDEAIIHAEEDAIFRCARMGEPTTGLTMVALWAPCTRCARAIISSSVRRVIVHKEMHDLTYAKYEANIEKAAGWLRQAGIEHDRWSGKVGGCQGMINHEIWEP